MADYLLQQGYKDPAAVIVDSVLEEHLRKQCHKVGIDVIQSSGVSKKADTLNSELGGASIYSKLDQKALRLGWTYATSLPTASTRNTRKNR
jgi:hypothetical protein